jgi:hypothetical protein
MKYQLYLSVLLLSITSFSCTPLTRSGQNAEQVDDSIKFVHFLSPEELSAQILQKPTPFSGANTTKISKLHHRANLLRQPVLTNSDRSNLLREPNKSE